MSLHSSLSHIELYLYFLLWVSLAAIIIAVALQFFLVRRLLADQRLSFFSPFYFNKSGILLDGCSYYNYPNFYRLD